MLNLRNFMDITFKINKIFLQIPGFFKEILCYYTFWFLIANNNFSWLFFC